MYSIDARNMVVRMRKVLGRSIRAISFATGVSKSTVHRWIKRHPCVLKAKKRVGFHAAAWQQIGDAIAAKLRECPFCSLEDLRNHLVQEAHVRCKSTSTVSRWLRHKLGYSRKRVSGKYVVRNARIDDLKQSFKQRMHGVPIDDVMSIDETSIYFAENSKYGYSPKGVPLKNRVQPSRKYIAFRLTLVLAVSSNQVVHYELMPGSCNTARFASFIRSLPAGCPHKLLMDNVAFHKTHLVQHAIRDKQLECIFVPPYSPQFNPIENVFAVLKAQLRRIVDNMGQLDVDAIAYAMSSIEGSALHNCFAHAWKLIGDIKCRVPKQG